MLDALLKLLGLKTHVLTPGEIRALNSIPILRRLSREQKQTFFERSLQFLRKVTISETGGGRASDEERAWIAASCALLYAGRPEWPFPPVKHVTLSPVNFDKQTFLPCAAGEFGGVFTEAGAYGRGTVSLNRHCLRHAYHDEQDGYHIGIHEFAHALDADTDCDGVPMFLPPAKVQAWLEALERARANAGQPGFVIREYGASALKETFTVVVEAFFEQPLKLRHQCGVLYAVLAELLNQDPAAYEQKMESARMRIRIHALIDPFIQSSRGNQKVVRGKYVLQKTRRGPAGRISIQTRKNQWSAPMPLPDGADLPVLQDGDAVDVVLERGRPYHVALPGTGHPVRMDDAKRLFNSVVEELCWTDYDGCHEILTAALKKEGFRLPPLWSSRPLD
ncbi:MAG TPA: zinc-dependent peptidase [Planctomycetota bacterium]|nr:zinc-dependent peptidase [Planctomycetota bacterium]